MEVRDLRGQTIIRWPTGEAPTLPDLRALVGDAPGQWRTLENGHGWRGEDGAVVNWFQATGAMQLQGPNAVRAAWVERLRARPVRQSSLFG